jgi:3-phytase
LNERKTDKIRVYRVDPGTRQLSRVDDDRIDTGSNYGFALYRSHETGRTYAFTGPEKGPAVSQWELVDNGAGRISGRGPLRRLHHGGISEGMVADDETGVLYMSEEKHGIWKFGAEPSAAAAGARILAVGEHGLVADVEGITLYHGAGGAGYLIVSSQGADRFNVYERKPPHAFRGSFAVTGVAATDGCDLVNLPLGDPFPAGAFACHNGERTPCPDELVSWADIAKALGLVVDTTSWDPRRSGLPRPGEEARAGPGSTMSPR